MWQGGDGSEGTLEGNRDWIWGVVVVMGSSEYLQEILEVREREESKLAANFLG